MDPNNNNNRSELKVKYEIKNIINTFKGMKNFQSTQANFK